LSTQKNSEKIQDKTAALANIQMKNSLISVFGRYFWHQVSLRPHWKKNALWFQDV